MSQNSYFQEKKEKRNYGISSKKAPSNINPVLLHWPNRLQMWMQGRTNSRNITMISTACKLIVSKGETRLNILLIQVAKYVKEFINW